MQHIIKKIINIKYLHQVKLNLNLEKYYHSEKGIFGYRPIPKAKYELPEEIVQSRLQQCNVVRWVDAFRSHGHRTASINPVQFTPIEKDLPELNPSRYGLADNFEIKTKGLFESTSDMCSVRDAACLLKNLYCNNLASAEFSYIESEHEREWLSENFEKTMQNKVDTQSKKEIAELLIKSQAWDNFLATKFPTVKRYGCEGAESMFAFFRQLFISTTNDEIEHIVLGMPHRGKLNLLTLMLQTRPVKIFRKFRGYPEFPSSAKAMCDIASHFNASEDIKVNEKSVHISMLHNPSHLEAVNPVSMGKTRSKQMTGRDGAFSDDKEKPFATSVLNVQLHGDAAFAGQGINQECLIMTGTPHFEIGGTIHMIVNNQIGFTTPGDRGRSTRYASDLAKCINAPIFHVNGDCPETLGLITKLAIDYQREFRKDVFIDLNCFRRWGHNELDDPTFTNPALYKQVHNRKSVPDNYVDKLIGENVITKEFCEEIVKKHMVYLNEELLGVDSYDPEASYFQKQWHGLQQASNTITTWDTGLDYTLLNFIGRSSVYHPADFKIHPHLLKTHVNARLTKLMEGKKIDWATAEAMAIGSLMYQGFNVRLSGEDVGRGTFSQRHAMLIDQELNEMYIPLNSLKGGLGGKLEIANSILSEEAVLGFEYGMAIDNPNNLIIWEAQFGDFFNGAQIILDTFIASGETKWMVTNGLVMLLPHGYDGAASEHSSCRIERFLQMTDSKETYPDADDVNMQIINPTTPAQYFHALRRQMVRNYRKPLVVVAPKTLLRLSEATSQFTDFEPGTTFNTVLNDTQISPISVKRVILCSGKHYYNLLNERNKLSLNDVAIIRVESLCPFPVYEIKAELEKYKNARVFTWSQEEPRNMGAWSYIKPRFENLLGHKIQYIGRPESATPAVGVSKWHQQEAENILTATFQKI